jgi:hypothetical protein
MNTQGIEVFEFDSAEVVEMTGRSRMVSMELVPVIDLPSELPPERIEHLSLAA